jgi:hypothetical protein
LITPSKLPDCRVGPFSARVAPEAFTGIGAFASHALRILDGYRLNHPTTISVATGGKKEQGSNDGT